MRLTESEQRAGAVAALRELADLLESDESLPVPQYGRLQACVRVGRPEGERFAAVRAFATRMDVDVIETPRRSRTATRFFGPFQYFAHANADDYDGAEHDDERIVPAAEDAELLTGTAAAS